jgi:glutathione S-transferase
MMRLHDNLSSGNGYKVRLLLTQLGTEYILLGPGREVLGL